MNVSSRKKQINKILILVTILAVPGFLYYLLQEKGKNRYKPLPIYGEKVVAATFHSVRGKQIPDTIYHEVTDFKLSNQNGDTVSLASFKGKVVIANLFYTTVDSDGAKIATKAMQGFNTLYNTNQMAQLVSVSVNPEDDISTIAKYARSINANAGKWDLLVGDATNIDALVRKSLLLDAVKTDTSEGTKFIYSNKIVLLDSKHRIRGFYEATSQESLSKLDDEIKVLIAEELRNMRDGR